MSFTDTGFVVRLLSEEDQSYYTIRVLELQNTVVSMRGRLQSGEMIFCEGKTVVQYCVKECILSVALLVLLY